MTQSRPASRALSDTRSEIAPPTPARRDHTIAAAIVLLHLCITVPLALYLNIWIDESYSFITTGRSLSFVIQHCREFELHAPLFYVLLWAWRAIEDSVPFARLLSAGAVALGLWMTHLVAGRRFPELRTAWVLLPLAINPNVMYSATEVRPYSFVFLYTATLMYLIHDGFLVERPSRRVQALYAATALAALYTYYYLGFILAAGAMMLVVERRWRALGAYVAWMSAVGALFLPQYLLAMGQMQSITHGMAQPPTLIRALEFTGSRVCSLPLGLFSFSSPARVTVLAVLGLVMLGIVWRFRRNVTAGVIQSWVQLAVIAGFYVFVVMYMFGEDSFIRHFYVAMLPVWFGMIAVVSMCGSKRGVAAATLSLVACGLCAAATYKEFGALAKAGDYRRAARFLEAHEKSEQPILVLASHAEYPLQHYYRGVNELVPLPDRDDYSVYSVQKWKIESVEQVKLKLAALSMPREEVWIFTDRSADAVAFGVKLNFDFVEDVLAQNYSLVSDDAFYQGRIRLFKKK